MKNYIRGGFVALIVATMIILPGCTGVSKADLVEILDQTQADIVVLEQNKDQIEDALLALPIGDENRTEMAIQLSKFNALIDQAYQRSMALEQAIQRIPEEEGGAFWLDVGAAIATAIGGPYGIAAAGVLATGAGIWRQRVGQVQGAERMALAVNRATDGTIRTAMIKGDLDSQKALAVDPDPVVRHAAARIAEKELE